jgi:hypothetical protein
MVRLKINTIELSPISRNNKNRENTKKIIADPSSLIIITDFNITRASGIQQKLLTGFCARVRNFEINPVYLSPE